MPSAETHGDPFRWMYESFYEQKLAALQTASHQVFGDISSWHCFMSGVSRALLATLPGTPFLDMLREQPLHPRVFVVPTERK